MTFREPESGPHVEPAVNGGAGTSTAAAPLAESDEALMAKIAGGDEIAFRMFALRHVPKCLAVAQRIAGNSWDAEEIVQDAMLRVWRHAPSWRQTDARVTTWLYRIVANLSVDRARKRRLASVPLDDATAEQADSAPTAEAILEARQIEEFIAAAISDLPARQRTALTLCYFEAMDCAQAAKVMGVSVKAMESLLVRGRRSLRIQLHLRGFVDLGHGLVAAAVEARPSPSLVDDQDNRAVLPLAAAQPIAS